MHNLSYTRHSFFFLNFSVHFNAVFRYSPGLHNVHRADLVSFQNCTPSATSVALTTGNDKVALASSGRKWYLCTKATHCATGNMKLAITVLPQVGSPALAPALAPAYSAATRHGAATICLAWIAAALGTFIMMMIMN